MTCLFKRIARKAAAFAMETIAPKDTEIRAVEESGLEGFASKVSRSSSADLEKDVVCLFAYKDPLVKKAVLEVKSRGNRAVADILGKAVYEALVEDMGELGSFERFTRPILVPIPMTRKSIRKRGWNQCLLIALAFKKYDTSNAFELAPDMLIKTRATEDQVGKGRYERSINLERSFEAKRSVCGRNVIVLDDICTTGATFREAVRALTAAGARKVICVALAH